MIIISFRCGILQTIKWIHILYLTIEHNIAFIKDILLKKITPYAEIIFYVGTSMGFFDIANNVLWNTLEIIYHIF